MRFTNEGATGAEQRTDFHSSDQTNHPKLLINAPIAKQNGTYLSNVKSLGYYAIWKNISWGENVSDSNVDLNISER